MDMDIIRSEQQLDLVDLPHIDETNYKEPDLPAIFSDEHFTSDLVTSLTDSKMDSRVRTSRVVQDAMVPVDARAARAAHLDPGGHISRAKGITINGEVKVKPMKVMYAHGGSDNKVDYKSDLEAYNSHKTIVNPEWDHNFVASKALSPQRFKRTPTSHQLRNKIANYVNKVFSSPSNDKKRGTFKTKFKNGERPALILENGDDNIQVGTKFATAEMREATKKSISERNTPIQSTSLHHQVSTSLPSVNLFSGSIDDNDSDINFHMTDSIEMAINEYGAYPIRQQEASSGFDANYHGNNNTHNVCNEEKEESAVHSSKINSSNNSFVVSQESSSEGKILSEVQSISIFFASCFIPISVHFHLMLMVTLR